MTIGHLPKLYNAKKTRCLTAPRFFVSLINLPCQNFLVTRLQNPRIVVNHAGGLPKVVRLVVVDDGTAFTERCLCVDEPLVATAHKEQVGVFQTLVKTAVNKHINPSQKLGLDGILQNLLYRETCVTPDGLVGGLLDHLSQLREGNRLIHRVAAGECYVRHFVGNDVIVNLLDVCGLAAVEIPSVRILTALALVIATGTIHRSPKTRAVGCGVVNYVHQLNSHRSFQKNCLKTIIGSRFARNSTNLLQIIQMYDL